MPGLRHLRLLSKWYLFVWFSQRITTSPKSKQFAQMIPKPRQTFVGKNGQAAPPAPVSMFKRRAGRVDAVEKQKRRIAKLGRTALATPGADHRVKKARRQTRNNLLPVNFQAGQKLE